MLKDVNKVSPTYEERSPALPADRSRARGTGRSDHGGASISFSSVLSEVEP